MNDSKEIDAQLKAQRHIAEENDARRRAERFKLPYLDLISVRVPTELKAMALIKEAEARASFLVPLQIVRTKLLVAVLNPDFPTTKETLARLKKDYELNVMVVSRTSLEHAWEYYRAIPEETADISGKVTIDEAHFKTYLAQIKTISDLTDAITNFKSPLTSQILEIILAGALSLGTSDIHLEAGEHAGTVRIRIDGILHDVCTTLTPHNYMLIVTRIKLLSNLKINVQHEAQDGRFTITLSDRDIEMRTSIIPSEFGETVVMRILDPRSLNTKLETLGWRPDDLVIIEDILKRPNGLILNTGPTGSGKTTTLYAFLKHMYSKEIKIITIEDPVEYHLEGISQTQVNNETDYTFANGLRSILRQDPDVILVGEIRDRETAEIAMNASLTGHLVFSTLHTNDAVGAIPRLIDLGAQPHIIGPAISLVIAQRLVRVLCPHCKISTPITSELKNQIDQFFTQLPHRVDRTPYHSYELFTAKGCEQCGGIGYHGRTSLFELFIITKDLEELIYQSPSVIQLKDLARAQGMTTMQEDGMLKILRGITDKDEVERLTGPLPWFPRV